ncbi:amidophosphoribosyltransferase [Acinetobacter pittii]|uniref:ComF family protein n=1 Tax=Acinetobacter pittii TaxID=48296 RepID=A0A8I1HEA6_ACIPI|nr:MULTISPECIES: phosphoribosyltransferase family protein [Acinetobacter calcoaceticus/baumannii complex]OIF62563.1 DNA transformation protein [Acinetobacter baumannii]AUT33004.1 ComF family protein [Acinetobacter pittii]AVN20799.1 ComF family protein [Acinetobacter pittii]EKU68768.1 comF family protein [Acinetobacter pittii]EXG31873.1 phosphoribosyl transferase domain protein [Acinetobacter sp. 263903-2]
MFNFLNFKHLIKLFSPCSLCELDTREKYSLCKDCWEQLPWLKQTIQRNNQSVLVACNYAYPVNRIIQQFKYEQKLHYQILLGEILKQLKFPKVQAIVPMPISNQRLIERGFNQSLLLANILSRHLKIPVWQPIQRLNEHSQKELTRLERFENIEQQFLPHHQEKRRYRRVLIIDDVITTGSSVHALSQALKQLGCTSIHTACLAATLKS